MNSIPITIGQINRSDRNTKITAAMTNAVFPTALTIQEQSCSFSFPFAHFLFPFLVCPATLCFETFEGRVTGLKGTPFFQALFRVFSHIKEKIEKRGTGKVGTILKGDVNANV